MAKKQINYFAEMTRMSGYSKKAAAQLVEMLGDYTNVNFRAEEIHVTEHEADMALHEVMTELNRSFITPIDREDIIQLVNQLDTITDSIEDVANLFDMLSIHEVRPEAKTLASLISQGCDALYDAVVEFEKFKSSKTLSDLIIRVNRVEEDGDRLYRSMVKTMYRDPKDVLELLKWKEILDTMERVLDNCEDAANLLDGLAIKNS